MDQFGIFFSKDWLDAVCGKANYILLEKDYKGSKAKLVFLKKKKGLFTQLLPPPYCAYNLKIIHEGIPQQDYTLYQKENEIISILIDHIPKASYLRIKSTLDLVHLSQFRRAKFQLYWGSTCLLKSGTDESSWSESLYVNTRNHIQKSSSIWIEENKLDAVHTLWPYSYYFKNHNVHLKELLKLLIEDKENERSICFSASDQNQNIMAALILYRDNANLYQSFSLLHPEHKSRDVIYKLTEHAIKWAWQRKLNYNFDGSMIPKLEKIYKSFGSEVTPYCILEKFSPSILGISKWIK